MKAKVITVVGNPGLRKIESNDKELLSRSLIPRAGRWLQRKLKISTVPIQDTRALAKLITSSSVDCVLAEYGMTGASIVDACEFTNVPLVVHFHGYDAYRKDILAEHKNSYTKLFAKSEKIIAVSLHMKNHLISIGAPENKVIHNSCGAEIDINSSIPFSERMSKQFIAVGRLTPKKGQRYVLEAFRQVLDKHPDATLLIVGDGDQRAQCEDLAKELRLMSNVQFLGTMNHDETLHLIANSFCFVQHSITAENGDMEGTPVAVMEAMSLGLPVVATRHGGILDIIHSEEVGILVAEKDVQGTANAMLTLLDNTRKAEEMGKQAKISTIVEWSAKIKNERLWKQVLGAINSKVNTA